MKVGGLSFPDPVLPAGAGPLREQVRAFLATQDFVPRSDAWLSGHDPAFSRALGAAGFVGMAIPERYGGHGRSPLDRYVVTEELLAAGAPVAAHWIADRQQAPLLLRYGSEELRRRIVPGIARGEVYFSIGMSEPDSGSDLASIRTVAEEVEGGFRVRGQKVWTSHAHRNHYLLALVRTDPAGEDRHEGLSQLVVDLAGPGVEVRPIRLLSGEEHFTEVIFDDAFVPAENLVGERGQGWRQVLSELAFERSGPERVLTTFPLLVDLLREVGPAPDERQAALLGRLVGGIVPLLRLSLSVAAALEAGDAPASEASLVKEVGTRHERAIVEGTRLVTPVEPRLAEGSALAVALGEAVVAAPGITLRGGTNEILRGIVARALGVR